MKSNKSNLNKSTVQSPQAKLGGVLKAGLPSKILQRLSGCFTAKHDWVSTLKPYFSDAKEGAELGYIIGSWIGDESGVVSSLVCAGLSVLYGCFERKRNKPKIAAKTQPSKVLHVQKNSNQPNKKKSNDFSEIKQQLFALNSITIAIRYHYGGAQSHLTRYKGDL